MIAQENLTETGGTIQVKTTQKKKTRPKRPPREFKKGRNQGNSEHSNPKRASRARIMITFENEPSYSFLLNDVQELKKLKPNSYLDIDYLNNDNLYRVHLYYKDDVRTRITSWENKYPNIRKWVEADDSKIRIIIDENNSLSKAILESLKLPFLAKNQKHGSPPTPTGESESKKKVKTNSLLQLPVVSNKKTRNQLLSQVNNLNVALKLTSDDLQEKMKSHQIIQTQTNSHKLKASQLMQASILYKMEWEAKIFQRIVIISRKSEKLDNIFS